MTDAQGSTAGYVFLRDEPAPADSFGAHQQVADAIALTMGCNPAIRTIGIIGPWGSGKSTVVRLLGKALAAWPEQKPPVFTFDAWLHHGEPVRRAFLEAFFHFCTDRDAAKKAKLRESVDQVTGRSTTTETFDEPRISWSGLTVLAAIALGAYGLAKGHGLRRIPWVAELLSWLPDWFPVLLPGLVPLWAIFNVALWRWAIARRLDITLAWVAGLAGIAIVGTGSAAHFDWHPVATGSAAAVVWLSAAGYGFWRTGRKLKTQPTAGSAEEVRTQEAQKEVPRNEESILGLLLSRQHQSKRTRVSGAPTPTAMEFSDVFQTTLAESFDEGSMVVIVIDNLDRLPVAEAKEAWAMLRTFFRAPKTFGPHRDPRPLVIIPVAEEAVATMYDTKDDGGGQSFMDKTFDVVFHLPRPVLTGWQRYLRERMQDLFGDDLGDEWVTQVTQMADARFLVRKDVITPRGINTLVNRLGAFWLQYRNAGIPFASVAYYCINKADIDDDILKEVEKHKVPVDVFDSEWRQAIAALHYGVALEDALPVLLTTPLSRAILERNGKAFNRLIDVPGAPTILRRILSTYRNERGLGKEVVLNSAFLLGGTGRRHRPHGPETWFLILDALAACGPWTGLTQQDVNDLFVLVGGVPGRQDDAVANIEACIRAIATPGAVETAPQVELWRHMVKHHPQAIARLPQIFVAGSGDVVVDVAAQLDDLPTLQAKLYCLSPESVLKRLVEDLTANQGEPDELARRMLAVGRTNVKLQWSAHLAESLSRVQAVASSSGSRNREAVARLEPAILSALMYATADLGSLQLTNNMLASRLGWLLQISLSNSLWSLGGLSLALGVVHGFPMTDLSIPPVPDAEWSSVAKAFVRGLRLRGLDVEQDGIPPSPPGHQHASPRFDYNRLVAEATDVIAQDKREREKTGAKPQTIAPISTPDLPG
jgi:hypothetical protein